MACEGGSAWCQFFSWLIEHSHDVELAGYPVARLLETIFGSGNAVVGFATENFKEILSFSVGAFGIWKWWVYRESILHERLTAFITESDARLAPTYRDVVRVVSRPDRRTKLRQPAYAYELARVLKRNRWEPVLRMDGGTHFVERQLTNAIRSIDSRMEIAEKSLNSLRQQRAAAETINAAIAASRAARARDQVKAKKLDQEALDAYRRVLQLPSHKSDVLAREGEAFHLLRLGHFDQAAQKYRQLEVLANDIADMRQRAFTLSRAMLARALMMQAAAPGGRMAAYDLVTYRNSNSAIALRMPFQPLHGWDAIEHAEIAYAGAFLSNRLNFVIIEADHLSIAREHYQRVVDANSTAAARLSNAGRQLRRAGQDGIARITRAEQDRQYDRAALFQQPVGVGATEIPASSPASPLIASTVANIEPTNELQQADHQPQPIPRT